MSTVTAPLPAPAPALRPAALASTDHKRVALVASALALAFFIAGGVLALIMRTQLAADGGVA